VSRRRSAEAAPDSPFTLADSVAVCVRRYLEELDGEPTSDFYAMVLSQVEPPLLSIVMEHTGNNQSRAAELLGLNRGTLRKKLREHGLLREEQAPARRQSV
jgi:Fis family transcriptional regulator